MFGIKKLSSKAKLRVIALALVLCVSTMIVPSVFAEEYAPQSSGGFATLDENGGLLLVGTARIPSSNGTPAAVKFIYSDRLIINAKSAAFIQEELKNCGVTISQNEIVSQTDAAETGSQRAVFAVGSPSAPTVLNACTPADNVQASFSALFPGYKFSITGYSSLNEIVADRSAMTISADGKTATASVVMGESYMDKMINNKKVTILMINSEYTYTFQAPKLNFAVDEFYVSPTDFDEPVQSMPEPTTEPTTEPNLGEVTEPSTASTTVALSADATPVMPIIDDAANYGSVTSDSVTTTTEPATTTAATTQSTTSTTIAATTTTASTTTTTAATTTSTTTTRATTVSTTAAATVSSPVMPTTQRTSMPASTTTTSRTSSVAPTAPSLPQNSDSISSQRAIVNTKRLPLNVRSGPGLNYMIVTVLPKGTYVTVLDSSNPDWYMIKTMGKVVGYASSEYIRIM